MKLIIYMPAYNEEENIQQVISALPAKLDHINTVEVLVIDDGSKDRTEELAKAAGAHVISHSKNSGVGAAFKSAIPFALENNADILVSIDADGQFDPREIPALIKPIIEGKADMVIGNRFLIVEKGCSDTRTGASKSRSKVLSWITSSLSCTAWTSISIQSAPSCNAFRMESNVFSGACPAAPR